MAWYLCKRRFTCVNLYLYVYVHRCKETHKNTRRHYSYLHLTIKRDMKSISTCDLQCNRMQKL